MRIEKSISKNWILSSTVLYDSLCVGFSTHFALFNLSTLLGSVLSTKMFFQLASEAGHIVAVHRWIGN